LHFCLVLVLDCDLPTYGLLPSWDDRCTTTPWTPACSSFFKVYIDCSRGFQLGISHVYRLIIQVKPITFSINLNNQSIIQQLTVHFIWLCSYADALCFNIIHYHSFFSLL
jgi:hypothetical protein